MRARTGCFQCVLDDVIGGAKLEADTPEQRERVKVAVLDYLNGHFDLEREPSEFITGVHRILKQVLAKEMPFKALRDKCNTIGVSLSKRVEAETEGLPERERFQMRLRWSIAGNELDFRTVGAGYEMTEDEIHARLSDSVAKPLAVDQTDAIYAICRNAKDVLFIPDNVGELAFDRVLVKEIRRSCQRITVPLRGGPITSDAVVADGDTCGIPSVADRVILAGPDTLGISWKEMSRDLREALATADVVIGKGQANYYVLTEHKDEIPGRVISLLRTKCDYVSGEFGLKGKVNVATVLK
ncbi:MAG: ARMT1-like domain-containing protein [Planctomycetes bacterium]|nr:ARMT1-like domain-containing protein [Planctomycetota bacterium]